MAHKFKPAAPMGAHFFMASALWTAIGLFLLYRGGRSLFELPLWGGLLMALAGAGVGVFKGIKVMRPTALKSVARIQMRGESACIFGFISWKSWLFVLSMALLGKWLRGSGITPWVLGPLLTGVGIALLIGVMVFWGALFNRLRGR